MNIHRWIPYALVVALALAQACPLWAAEPLTLTEALQRALTGHPDLQGFDAERVAMRHQREMAGLGPSPEIGVHLEDALGSGEHRGLRRAQSTLSYARAVELGGQRDARLALVAARRDALGAGQIERQRRALLDVAQCFATAVAERERSILADEHVVLAQRSLAAVAARVTAARAPAAELSRARATLARATLEQEHARHLEQSARLALAVALGQPSPEFGELQAELYQLPALRALADLRGGLADNPAAQERLAKAAVHDAERRAALSAAGMQPTFSAGLRHYAEDGDVALVAGVSLPIGRSGRAESEARLAAAQLGISQAEHRAASLRAEQQLVDLYQEIVHAQDAMTLFDGELLPALAQALAEAQDAYASGRYGYLELADALKDYAAARAERLDTAARYHLLLAQLEYLAGDAVLASSSGSAP